MTLSIWSFTFLTRKKKHFFHFDFHFLKNEFAQNQRSLHDYCFPRIQRLLISSLYFFLFFFDTNNIFLHQAFNFLENFHQLYEGDTSTPF
jgi:hypothetical protein